MEFDFKFKIKRSDINLPKPKNGYNLTVVGQSLPFR